MIHKLAQILETLAAFAARGDLPGARQAALDALCEICDAHAGFLLLQEDQPVIRHGESFDTVERIEAARRFLISENAIEQHDDLILLRLSFGDETFGAVVLRTIREEPEPVVRSIVTFLGLIEQSQRLRRLLDLSQEGLRNLSRESATIAESNSRLFQKMISNESHLRSISRGILRMQEEERSKISRELHDGIGQALTALKINMDILSKQIEADLSPQSVERFNEVKVLAENSLEDVRELSRLLRPRILDDLGLFPTLRWYVRRYSERTGINVKLQLQETEQRLDPEIETMLFRITQEALNNIAKHSQSPTAGVRLQIRTKEIELEIDDEGAGFDASENQSTGSTSGISGMRDRVSLWSGTFSIHSQPGVGTRLHVTVPLRNMTKKRQAKRG